MKRIILIFCVAVAAIAIGKPNATDGKYDVNFIYCLSDSKLTYSAIEGLEPASETTTIKGVNSIWATKSLYWCINNLYNVNSSLWDYYFSTDGTVASTKALAVLHAISANNANFQAMLSQYAYDCTRQFATDTTELEKSYDKVVEKVNQNDSSNLTKLKVAIDQKSAELQSEITGVTTEMTSLRGQISKNEGDVESAIARVESLQTQLTQLSLSAALNNQASSFNLPPISMPIASIADSNFTNAIMSISKYLGADNEVNTNGVTFVPPSINGEPAKDIIEYLNNKGVVGFHDSSSEETNSPFAASFTLKSNDGATTLTAPFIAPSNWADGKTVIVTNGHFTIHQTTDWAYYDGAFHNCNVQLGSQSASNESMAWGVAGAVYVIVTYAGKSVSLSLSPTPQSEFGIKASFQVGNLISDGEGGFYNSYSRSAPIVIYCYE